MQTIIKGCAMLMPITSVKHVIDITAGFVLATHIWPERALGWWVRGACRIGLGLVVVGLVFLAKSTLRLNADV
jgi:hypothetical protein